MSFEEYKPDCEDWTVFRTTFRGVKDHMNALAVKACRHSHYCKWKGKYQEVLNGLCNGMLLEKEDV